MSTRCAPFLIAFLILVSASASSQPPPGGGSWDAVAHSAEFGHVVKPTTAEDEGRVTFRSQTILIEVPVVITDKNGNHIHGLSRSDFRVLENGKEQKIATFEEKVSTNAKIPQSPAQPGEFSNLTVSEQQPRAVTVIAIDTVNTPYLDQAIGRHELIKFLANNIDTSQVLALMIMTSHGVKVVQGLTGDPGQLAQVLKKVSGEMPQNQATSLDNQANAALGDIPVVRDSSSSTSVAVMMAQVQAMQDYADTMAGQFQQTRAIEMTMNSFLKIAWALSGVPGRKSIIWASSGFPFVITSPDVVPGSLGPLYERTMKALTDGQISVYPVDVRGITTRGEGEATPGPLFSRGQGPSVHQMNNRSWLESNTIQSLNEFAEMTGGKAFYNSNDLAGSFKRAADDSSSYYLVGYYLDTKNNHAGWRQLKVGVDKKDTEVRARKGFFVTKATIDADSTRDYDLHTALTSPIEATGVPVTLKWTGISGEGDKKKAAFLIQIPPNGVTLEGGEQARLSFDVAVTAYRINGKTDQPVLTLAQKVDTAVSPQQLAMVRAKGVSVSKDLALGPGEYAVRLVVRDSATGKIGSVTAPLTVN
jgi:VWFA-related protein